MKMLFLSVFIFTTFNVQAGDYYGSTEARDKFNALTGKNEFNKKFESTLAHFKLRRASISFEGGEGEVFYFYYYWGRPHSPAENFYCKMNRVDYGTDEVNGASLKRPNDPDYALVCLDSEGQTVDNALLMDTTN